MRIIISPAKKMRVDTDSLPWRELPVFLSKTKMIAQTLQKKEYDELKRIWKCNDAIAALNMDRFAHMDLTKQLTPAILSYEGIQYQYMAPGVFTQRELDYVQEHLRILSGFYGVLKPFDGVTPYRLEMQAKLQVNDEKDLYAFWGNEIAEQIFSETDCIINLASKEYSVCILKFLPKDIRFITCVFGEEKDGKVIEKGTMCKMARGEMVRYLAENDIENPDRIKEFHRLGYQYNERYSNDKKYIFIKNATEN